MAGAANEITTDIVGYNTKTSVQGCNFLAAGFLNMGYNTVDIQQLVISDGGMDSIGWGLENFAIWEGAPDPVVGSGFAFSALYDEDGNQYYAWTDDEGKVADFSFDPEQGVVIDCAEGLELRSAGKASDTEGSLTTVAGCNFIANPFAEAIDIQDITIDDGGMDSIGWGLENFAIWEGAPDPVVGSGFAFSALYDEDGNQYYAWTDDEGKEATYPIPAGQAFVLDCAADLTVTIKAPYSLTAAAE